MSAHSYSNVAIIVAHGLDPVHEFLSDYAPIVEFFDKGLIESVSFHRLDVHLNQRIHKMCEMAQDIEVLVDSGGTHLANSNVLRLTKPASLEIKEDAHLSRSRSTHNRPTGLLWRRSGHTRRTSTNLFILLDFMFEATNMERQSGDQIRQAVNFFLKITIGRHRK